MAKQENEELTKANRKYHDTKTNESNTINNNLFREKNLGAQTKAVIVGLKE